MLFEIEESRTSLEFWPMKEKYGKSKSLYFFVSYDDYPFKKKEGVLTIPKVSLFNIFHLNEQEVLIGQRLSCLQW